RYQRPTTGTCTERLPVSRPNARASLGIMTLGVVSIAAQKRARHNPSATARPEPRYNSMIHSARVNRSVLNSCLPRHPRNGAAGVRLHTVLCAFAISLFCAPQRTEAASAIAMHGVPALPADFTAVPYANPDAPKGGRLVEGVLGTFDSLNPLIVQG